MCRLCTLGCTAVGLAVTASNTILFCFLSMRSSKVTTPEYNSLIYLFEKSNKFEFFISKQLV